MNILCKIFLVLMLCSYSFRATSEEAQRGEAQIGSGLVCDTAQQAERFVSLFSTSAKDAIETVNREAGDPEACVVTTVLFTGGKDVSGVLRSYERSFRVVELQVIGITTPIGLRAIRPLTWYAIIKVDEIGT
jgi:hypothetical protein